MSLKQTLYKIQRAVSKVEKDGNNPHHKSKYATLEAVLEALDPSFDEHKLTLVQYPQFNAGAGWELMTKIAEVEGTDEFSFGTPLLGMDAASNKMQALGSAITYARRYALVSFFKLVQTDDDGNTAGTGSMTINKEKKASPPAKAAHKPAAPPPKEVKNHAPPSKTMVIPDGQFKGRRVVDIHADELHDYITNVEASLRESGKRPPKWFLDVKALAAL